MYAALDLPKTQMPCVSFPHSTSEISAWAVKFIKRKNCQLRIWIKFGWGNLVARQRHDLGAVISRGFALLIYLRFRKSYFCRNFHFRFHFKTFWSFQVLAKCPQKQKTTDHGPIISAEGQQNYQTTRFQVNHTGYLTR